MFLSVYYIIIYICCWCFANKINTLHNKYILLYNIQTETYREQISSNNCRQARVKKHISLSAIVAGYLFPWWYSTVCNLCHFVACKHIYMLSQYDCYNNICFCESLYIIYNIFLCWCLAMKINTALVHCYNPTFAY